MPCLPCLTIPCGDSRQMRPSCATVHSYWSVLPRDLMCVKAVGPPPVGQVTTPACPIRPQQPESATVHFWSAASWTVHPPVWGPLSHCIFGSFNRSHRTGEQAEAAIGALSRALTPSSVLRRPSRSLASYQASLRLRSPSALYPLGTAGHRPSRQ